MPGMAPGDALHGKAASMECAMAANGFLCVMSAAWREAADTARFDEILERGNDEAVDADEEDKGIAHQEAESFSMAALSSAKLNCAASGRATQI